MNLTKFSIDTVIDEYEKDAIISPTELDKVSLESAKLYSKYLRYMNIFFKAQKELDRKRKFLKQEKIDYFSGRASSDIYKNNPYGDKLSKVELVSKVDADKEIADIDSQYTTASNGVEICKYILKSIGERSFNVKNAIEFQKFQSGA